MVEEPRLASLVEIGLELLEQLEELKVHKVQQLVGLDYIRIVLAVLALK